MRRESPRRPRDFEIEYLESRHLMAIGSVTFTYIPGSIYYGELEIQGTAAGEFLRPLGIVHEGKQRVVIDGDLKQPYDWISDGSNPQGYSFHPVQVRALRIDALGGNDTIYLRDLDDIQFFFAEGPVVWGDTGDDTIYGSVFPDFLHGDAGNDEVYGGADDDWITGSDGNDYIEGGDGWDTLYGGSSQTTNNDGADTTYGWSADSVDSAIGTDGGDLIIGGGGNDRLYGDTDLVDS